MADRSTDTGRRLNLDVDSMPRNSSGLLIDPSEYNRSDGFSPGQLIVTKVPGLDTPEAFRRTGAVPVTDLARSFDRGQPIVVINARTHRRHLIWSELDSNPTDPADVALLIRPAVNLEEGTRYIVALRNLRDASGRILRASRAFRIYRDRKRTREPVIERRRRHMESIFRTLRRADIRRHSLYRRGTSRSAPSATSPSAHCTYVTTRSRGWATGTSATSGSAGGPRSSRSPR